MRTRSDGRQKVEEVRRGQRRGKEKWAAERATPKVGESQSGSPASRFQPHSMCLMGNPTEKPLTLNKEVRREMVDTERGGKRKDRVGWVYGGKKVSEKYRVKP